MMKTFQVTVNLDDIIEAPSREAFLDMIEERAGDTGQIGSYDVLSNESYTIHSADARGEIVLEVTAEVVEV